MRWPSPPRATPRQNGALLQGRKTRHKPSSQPWEPLWTALLVFTTSPLLSRTAETAASSESSSTGRALPRPESMAAQTAITLPVPEFLIIGDAFLDVQCSGLAQLPRWDADELVPRPIEFLAGGGGLNTACHLARAGRRVELRCALGDDDAGAKLRSAAAHAGVAVVPLAAPAGAATGVCIVLSGQSDRAFATHRGAVAVAGLSDADIERAREVGARGGHVHVAGYYNMPAVRARVGELFRAVREAGGSSSLNPQWDADERWDGICELSVAAGTAPGVLICSEAEVENLAGTGLSQAPLDLLDAGNTRCVVTTHGARGAIVWGLENEQVKSNAPTLAPGALLDATGAGDAFAAGFLTAFARDPPGVVNLSIGLKMGCAYGAACCGVVGASAALDPSRVAAYAREIVPSPGQQGPVSWSARPRRPPSQ